MYSVWNTLSEYTYFYISKNITSYTFLLVFKIVESLQCILTVSFCHVYASDVCPLHMNYFNYFELNHCLLNFNPLNATGRFLYPLKTSENLWFSDVFKEYRKRLIE